MVYCQSVQDGGSERRTYVMRVRADATARTRRLLVDCAAELLRTSAQPIRLVEIAAAAGVSRTTLYRHFPSATSLIDAVAADLLARAHFDDLLAAVEHADPVAALTQVTTIGCGIWAIDPPLVRNLVSLARAQVDALPVIDGLEAGRARVMERLIERLEEQSLLRAGLNRADAVDLLMAATHFAAWDQLVTSRSRSPQTATAL
ncbi:MAG: TetR/AcrR family transcriptional regulator, partial [Chloroflexi bacterium]|nr:TetR/AcrR family transcriptional regulator [Chloroflexota bacterium]